MSLRGTANPTPEPGRFRCLVCRKVVIGTPSGHCPQCGFVPPKSIEVPTEHDTAWRGERAIILVALSLLGLYVLWFYVL